MSEQGDDKATPWWSALLAEVVKALRGALAFFAGWWTRDGQEKLKKAEEKNEGLAKQVEVERLRADDAERQRVRDRWKDPS